ncbi:MAG TPA: HEAT repeat domain-containing protein [Pirellulaceae bacterium]|jgi:HEAT repeat protein
MSRRILACRLFLFAVLFASIERYSAADDFLGRSFEQWSEMLNGSQQTERSYAAWALGQIATERAGSPNDQVYFAELIKLIHDNDPTVRYWGVLGLAGYAHKLPAKDGGKTAVANSVTPLLEDKSAAPRIAAAQTLGLVGQPEKALPVLIAAMSDPQDSARIQAATALEKLGEAARPAIATLEKGTSDSSEYVKRISERSLQALDPNRKSAEPSAKAKKNKGKAKKAA